MKIDNKMNNLEPDCSFSDDELAQSIDRNDSLTSSDDDNNETSVLESYKNILRVADRQKFDEGGEKLNVDFDNLSDDETNPQAHYRLLEEISRIDRHQHIKAPTRTELSNKKSEFHLVKSTPDGFKKPHESLVTIHGLMQTLQKTNKHTDIVKDLQKLQRSTKGKTLDKPVEKPIADKISRVIAYEKTRLELDRWDAVVENNRESDCQIFPLKDADDIEMKQNAVRAPMSYRIKTDLMEELAALTPKDDIGNTDENSGKSKERMREEIFERRKELARLRLKESYQIEKMKRQSKIKSKKYHRVLKKEKLKNQLKEFEQLQKTDPEEALRRLEMLEQNRVQERANLRHRNTGTWAKNLQIRAKYDKDVRKELAQQVSIGRELKQKHTLDESSDDDNAEQEEKKGNDYDPFNPWMKEKGEVGDFVSGYKKYWEERNNNENKRKEYDEDNVEEGNEDSNGTAKKEEQVFNENESLNLVKDVEKEDEFGAQYTKVPKKKTRVKSTTISPKKQKKTKQDNGWTVEDCDEDELQLSIESFPNLESKKRKPVLSIDEIFDEAEEELESRVTAKLKKIRDHFESDSNFVSNDVRRKQANSKKVDLSFKKQAKHPELDEEMNENVNSLNDQKENDEKNTLRKLLNSQREKENKAHLVVDSINPNKFIAIVPKHLKTAFPDILNTDVSWEQDEEDDRHYDPKLTIAEAFEDDDIIADFDREKKDEINSELPKDINLTLPGWGSWTGKGITPKTPNKKLVLKFPKELPRKDKNRTTVIINEKIADKLKEHLVSDLPFPFTSVKDFEASIRAPLSRTFVPETALKVLTKPAIITKMGTIIKPMDDSILLQNKQQAVTKTAKRIANMKKNSNSK